MAWSGIAKDVVNSSAHQKVTYDAALSFVLLKNTGVLPLRAGLVRSDRWPQTRASSSAMCLPCVEMAARVGMAADAAIPTRHALLYAGNRDGGRSMPVEGDRSALAQVATMQVGLLSDYCPVPTRTSTRP